MTYEHPWYTQQSLLENTTNLELKSKPKQQKESLGQRRTDLSGNRKGDIAELFVCLIAQWKGAEVFTNIGCDGKTDLVLNVNGNLVEIDVKLAQYQKIRENCYVWRAPDASNVELPVYPVMVIPDGDIMHWKIRWKNSTPARNSQPHCPPGLEDFWDDLSTHV